MSVSNLGSSEKKNYALVCFQNGLRFLTASEVTKKGVITHVRNIKKSNPETVCYVFDQECVKQHNIDTSFLDQRYFQPFPKSKDFSALAQEG